MRRLTNCFSFQRPRSRICACSSCSSGMRSKQSQNSCEVKRSGAKPHWERRMVRSYQSATSVFGPGWQTRCVLKDVVGAVSGGGASVKLRKTLVTAQVAFSFLLLVGSGLFVRTLANLKQTNAGFQAIDNLVTFQVDPALSGYSMPRLQAFYRQLQIGREGV